MAKDNDREHRQPRQLPAKISLETGIDLPSYDMSAVMNISNPEIVREMMKRIQRGEKPIKPSSTVSPIMPGTDSISVAASVAGINTSISEADQSVDGGLSVRVSTSGTSLVGHMKLDEPEGEVVTCVSQENFYQDQTFCYDPLPFTAGRTEPLEGITTVDASQIEEAPFSLDNEVNENELFGEGAGIIMSENLPAISLNTAGYSRFRYKSERNAANKRPRQYEMDEDKRCLAEIEVKNYTGAAKLIVYCVNSQGKLHPYQLFGSECNRGVFVRRVDFGRKQRFAKLLKVSITTPKAKEYNSSIQEQRTYLEEMNVITEKEVPHKNENNGDKQVVYLMVKVILEESPNTVLSRQSKEIRNKKEGTEFKIRSVIPPCVPISGPCEGNLDKNKVCVIVTDNTAFPKDICVVMRKTCEDGAKWLRVLKQPEIEVIRRSVVEFSPPPFRIPDLKEDVEVELLLRDLKTSQETDPVTFTYKGTDEYGVMAKGTKRKLGDTFDNFVVPGKYPQAERKTLTAVRKVTGIESSGNVCGQIESSPENALTIVEDQSTPCTSGSYLQTLPQQDVEISIGGMRHTRQTSQTVAPETSLYNQATGPSINTLAVNSLSASVKNEITSPQVSRTAPNFNTSQIPNILAQGNPNLSPEVVRQLQQLIFQNQGSTSTCSSMPLLTGELPHRQEAKRLPQEQTPPVVPRMQPAIQQPVQPKPVIDPAFSNQLPKLNSNQMFAVIKGQIVIINDDTKEVPAENTHMVQNIGGQEVHVQRMPTQQPSEDSNIMLPFTQSDSKVASDQVPYLSSADRITQNFLSQALQKSLGTQGFNRYQQQQTGNQSVMSSQQLQNETSHEQTISWQISNTLDDDDLEIDSGSQIDKKRPKTNNVDNATGNSSYQNLPKIITDSTEDSEVNVFSKEKQEDSSWQGNVYVYVSGSEDDSDDMQS